MARKRKSSAVSFFAFQDVITAVVGVFVLITIIMVLELAQTVADASETSSMSLSPELVASLEMLTAEVNRLKAEFDSLTKSAAASASNNRFNRPELMAEAKAETQRIHDQIQRTEALSAEIKKRIVDAEQTHEHLIAESQAAEGDRATLNDIQDRSREIEGYSSVLEIDRPLIFRNTTQENRYLVLVELMGNEIQLSDSEEKRKHRFVGIDRLQSLRGWLQTHDLKSRHLLVIVKPSAVDDFDPTSAVLKEVGAMYGFEVATEDAKYVLHFETGSAG